MRHLRDELAAGALECAEPLRHQVDVGTEPRDLVATAVVRPGRQVADRDPSCHPRKAGEPTGVASPGVHGAAHRTDQHGAQGGGEPEPFASLERAGRTAETTTRRPSPTGRIA